MLTIKTREENFGSILYNSENDRFTLRTNYKKEDILDEKLSAPLTLHWLLTMRCNARCPYCYELPYLLKPTDRENGLSKENVSRIINDLADNNVFRVYLTGGEPTLSPILNNVLESAYLKEIKAVVNSNGINIPEETYNSLKKYQARLSLSLDSYIKETHDKARKQKSYDAIINIMKKSVNEGIDIRVISVVDNNIKYKTFGAFLSDLGVKSWFIQAKTDNGSEIPANKELEVKLKEYFPEMNIRVLPAIFDSFMYLLPNGDLGVNLWNPNKKIYGNILENKINYIWDIHKYNKVRDHQGILHFEQ